MVIDNKQMKTVPSVERLGIQLDDKLNFSPHLSNICKSVKFKRKEDFNK